MTTGFTSKRQYKNDLNLLCQWCDKRFTAATFRLFCEHQCKVEYYASLNRHLWTEDEEQFILDLVGLYPMREIVRRTKRYLTVEVPASHIKEKVERLVKQEQIRLSDRVDNYNIGVWARLLGGINELRIHRWVSKGLKTRRSGKEHMITHKNMIAFAKEHLSYFQSIERQYLEWLFGEEKEWVDLALNSKPCKSIARPILCVTTNVLYPSLTKAEKATGISRNRIVSSLKSNIPMQNDKGEYLAFKYAD